MVSKIQKKLCSDCKARFDVDWSELEEGDAISCPECNLEYVVVRDRKGSLKLVESKEFDLSDDDDSDGFDDDESEYDYDSD
ncbi:MAG: hypothetical protein ACOX1V_03635 [Candidatus Iainarchaeum sp.]|jgi:DNA-directed RNA polymerase subunit RPC12/RpoP|nr:MAG: hypothetical protein BWY55_00514 [archaeon ADurb.Bin336]